MANNPCVSFGLPIYNGEEFIATALDSILSQTFANFELIISDNASTDNTQEICQEYAAKDGRIRYYRNQENIGAAPNYNRVFELAKGKYFKWVAHDDLLDPNFLEKCVTVLESCPEVVLCYSLVTFVDQQGQELKKSESNLLALNSSAPHERFRCYHQLLEGKTPQSLTNHQQHCAGERWTVIFGLMRTEELAKTAKIASFVNSDVVLLGELALRGKFSEIPLHLWFYRDHDQASGRKHNGYDEYNAWFDPTNQGKLILPLWTWFFAYLAAIARTPLHWKERVACFAQMGQWLLRKRRRLIRELLFTLAKVLQIKEISWRGKKKSLPTQW